jgi:hypothetical protein
MGRPPMGAASRLGSDLFLVAQELVTEPHAWPAEQSARGTLRRFHDTAVGYLAVLFEDPAEAR